MQASQGVHANGVSQKEAAPVRIGPPPRTHATKREDERGGERRWQQDAFLITSLSKSTGCRCDPIEWDDAAAQSGQLQEWGKVGAHEDVRGCRAKRGQR
jgi:hypothetical protein